MMNSLDFYQNDCRLLRILCIIGFVISPLVKLAWSFTISKDEFFNNDVSVIQAAIFSGLFLTILISSYLFSIVRKYSYYILYGLYMIATVGFGFVLKDNNFSIQSLLLMVLFTISINMVVKKLIHLIWYDIFSYTLILTCLAFVEHAEVPKTFLVFFFLFYYLYNLGFVYMKLKTRRALEKRENSLRGLLKVIPQAIIICVDDKILYSNQAAGNLTGVKDANELQGKTITSFLINSAQMPDKEAVEVNLLDHNIPNLIGSLSGDMSVYREEKLQRIDGQEVDVEVSTVQAVDDNGQAIMYIIKDISERKAVENKIHQLAFYDSLTGLPNRYNLNHILQNTINEAAGETGDVSVLFMDLDGFKSVNDTMGHTYGDQLLQQVAERLVKCVRIEDIVSRYGGDEFVIMLKGSSKSSGYTVAHRIINAFSLPFNIECKEIYITPSIGISIYPNDGTEVSSLIKNADAAMYQAKKKGKNNFQYYRVEMEENPEGLPEDSL